MEHKKNETILLDNVNKTTIRYNDNRNKFYKMSHMTKIN